MSSYFSIPKAWISGERITNANASLLRAGAFIPSGVWLKSPSAPGSKRYYMALRLGFSSQMGIWGPTQRQIGYQSQGWYKDRLWKSIGRQSYIGLAYLFLHHSEWGPSSVQASAQSPTQKARSGPSEPDRRTERARERQRAVQYTASYLQDPVLNTSSHHLQHRGKWKTEHIKNTVPIYIYQLELRKLLHADQSNILCIYCGSLEKTLSEFFMLFICMNAGASCFHLGDPKELQRGCTKGSVSVDSNLWGKIRGVFIYKALIMRKYSTLRLTQLKISM